MSQHDVRSIRERAIRESAPALEHRGYSDMSDPIDLAACVIDASDLPAKLAAAVKLAEGVRGLTWYGGLDAALAKFDAAMGGAVVSSLSDNLNDLDRNMEEMKSSLRWATVGLVVVGIGAVLQIVGLILRLVAS